MGIKSHTLPLKPANTRSFIPFLVSRFIFKEKHVFGHAKLREAGHAWRTLYQQNIQGHDELKTNTFIMSDAKLKRKCKTVTIQEIQDFARLGVYYKDYYKDGSLIEYFVVGHAFMFDNDDDKSMKGKWYVIYRRMNEPVDQYWARPLQTFKKKVVINGVEKDRFKWIRKL